jgi:hypothetical protein
VVAAALAPILSGRRVDDRSSPGAVGKAFLVCAEHHRVHPANLGYYASAAGTRDQLCLAGAASGARRVPSLPPSTGGVRDKFRPCPRTAASWGGASADTRNTVWRQVDPGRRCGQAEGRRAGPSLSDRRPSHSCLPGRLTARQAGVSNHGVRCNNPQLAPRIISPFPLGSRATLPGGSVRSRCVW